MGIGTRLIARSTVTRRVWRLIVAGLLAYATQVMSAERVFEFPLTAEQNFPVHDTQASGDCSVILDDVSGAVSVDCTFENLAGNATLAHIHGLAPPGENADVILGLVPTTTQSGTIVGSGTLSAEQLAGMIDGQTYINLHSMSFQGGEIRGQIVNAVSTANAGFNDAWVSENAPFQGVFLTVFPDLGLIFLAWFTFDSSLPLDPDSAVFGAHDQRWVTALGSIDGLTASLKAELTSGGQFNSSDPIPQQNADYGTIDLVFISCEAVTLTYEFPSASLSGTFNLARVLNSNAALCEMLDL